MLKDWLVRRRENPYPSREEKKALAIRTGLTYIQVRRLCYLITINKFKRMNQSNRSAIGLPTGVES